MTDFLGRVAARAVGASAAARPRVAGLFEPLGIGDDPTLEVVEEEVVAPAPTPPSKETPGATENGRRAAPLAAAPPVKITQPARPPDVPAAQRPTLRAEFVAQSNNVPVSPPAIGPHEGEPEPATTARVEQRAPAPVVVAAPLAQALPVAAARAAAAPPPAPVAEHDEEPPVRVHIGRLEVRANVQPPAPERPRRELARDDGPSLADYLRGKREVRT